MSVDAKRFRAFIVGIDVYPPGLRSLAGAVRDALDFARWLVKCGVAPQSLFLCLAGKPEDLLARTREEFPGATVQPATRQDIWNTLEQCLSDAPDDFFMYWASHGMMDARHDHHLLCSDAKPGELRNFCLTDIEAYLRTSQAGGYDPSRLARTVLIVDACSDYPSSHRDSAALKAAYPVPADGTLVPRDQFALVSCQANDSALEDEKGGLFTQRLLRSLGKKADLAELFDLKPLHEKMLEEFAKLHAQNKTGQYPFLSEHKYWGHPRRSSAQEPEPPGLDICLERNAIGRTDIADLMKLTRQMTTPPTRDLINEAFRSVDDSYALPSAELPPPDAFRYCLQILGARLDKTALFQFIEICRSTIDAAGIGPQMVAWEGAAAHRMRLDLAAIRARATLRQPKPSGSVRILQFLAKPLPGFPKNREEYQLYGRITPGPNGEAALLERAEHSAKAKALPAVFTELSLKLMSLFAPDELIDLRMEAILPADLLPYGACNWPIRNGAGVMPITYAYDVTLRSYERAYGRYYHVPRVRAAKKWRTLLAGFSRENVAWMSSTTPPDAPRLLDWSKDEHIVLCAENLALRDAKKRSACVEGLIAAGIPLAVWFLPSHEIPDHWEDSLTRRFIPEPYGSWPAIARAMCKSEDGPKYSLAVLLDDHTVPPPDEPGTTYGALKTPASGNTL